MGYWGYNIEKTQTTKGEKGKLKSKQSPNNCITCGVDLNHCVDKDLENNQCGFCSPKKHATEMIIENKTYDIKSTFPLQILFSSVVSLVIGLIVWQGQYENLVMWIMVVFVTNMFLWRLFLGSIMLKEKTVDKIQKVNDVE